MTLKTGLGVRQGHWKCYHMRIQLFWRSMLTMALSRVVSEIFNVAKCRDLEIGVKGHWKWYHSINCVWFPICVH